MKLRWTLPAVEQLREIFEYIADDNPAAAARSVERIRLSIRQASRMPYAGRGGRVGGTREVIVPGTSYIVAYRILEDAIHVLAILHGTQQWPESF
ncbi:MAG: type II toxin-antitoxin system RelE/ParE family toxin [Terracidiphilus sp.]|nr:type II toxin-antitoxin system RelE/ParE family toxin [Terracidiphilus sp.]MDR3799799.1 type II toxin-antitoxin system RelE/ParE family toxin [Terracidiphilus sp.]